MNEHLAADGWEITERGKISGKSVYGGRRRLLDSGVGVKAAKDLAVEFDATYLSQQTTRMEAAMQSDPELAIGSAKEFVETICKTILKERAIPLPPADDFPQLVRTTIKSLRLVPEAISDGSGGEQIIKIFLNNLGSISNTLAALRNPYGTGHGKEATHEGLEEHHARLAVGVATAFGVFLYEAHKNTPSN